MRRIREEKGYLQRLIDMSNGIIPMDKESIKYYDPKKVKVTFDSPSTSGDENDDWRDNSRRSRRPKTPMSLPSSSSDDELSETDFTY